MELIHTSRPDAAASQRANEDAYLHLLQTLRQQFRVIQRAGTTAHTAGSGKDSDEYVATHSNYMILINIRQTEERFTVLCEYISSLLALRFVFSFLTLN
jgi:hypothetical protein